MTQNQVMNRRNDDPINDIRVAVADALRQLDVRGVDHKEFTDLVADYLPDFFRQELMPAPDEPSIIELAKAKLQEIVCVEEPDAGVVLLSEDSPTTYDHVRKCQVYKHENFSPLGDALIELWDILDGGKE